MGCTSRDFMLRSSHATLGYFFFFFSVFNIFFPTLSSKLSFVLLTDASSTNLPHWVRQRR
jgi:hypothetical protein